MNSIASTAALLASQRVCARGRIVVRHDGERTRLVELFQDGAAKMRIPATTGAANAPLEAVLINTAGGLTGGDRLAWQVGVGPGAELSLTTQACEKVYRAGQGEARVVVNGHVGIGGRLAWLPQETILFDRSAFSRDLHIELRDGASALVVEATLFGRTARGERVHHAMFRDRWRIRRDDRLVHAEDMRIGPDVDSTLARTTTFGGAVATATVLFVSDAAAGQLDAVREIVGDDGSASFWRVGGTGKLLARLVAADGYQLRKRLQPLVALLNGTAGLPKIWTT